MTTSERCQRCGAAVPAESTDSLCPACLMSGALNAENESAATMSLNSGEFTPRAEVTEFPCELGDYRLVGLLGRGGMGTVYEAEQIATGRRVALKMLGHQLDTPDLRQRFLREGRLAAGVNHPNSLYVFGSEEIEGLPVITMEIAGSGTLKDKLKRRGPLPITEAVDAMLDVVAGLEAAHAQGVLHRDIKPSNCFVGPDGSVKVGDFGLSVSTLAKDDSYVTATGVIMGTPAFAAPEQLRGDELDVRADIYSVGATLFTLLTGQAPFEGRNAVQVVANAVNQKPKAAGELREGVPPELERVVARCLAKEPEQRYADYAALRDALLPLGSTEPEPASLEIRASVGWVDYLIAFLVPYIFFMLLVGGEELLIRPLIDRTLYSARYYLAMFGFGFLYFGIAEGLWGAGFGKRMKGLRVVRADGRPPGLLLALARIVLTIASVEGLRWPITMAVIREEPVTGMQIVWMVIIANACAWISMLLTLSARPDNGFASVWDLVTGTRVVIKTTSTDRPIVEPLPLPELPNEGLGRLGPYRLVKEWVPGRWIIATDPVLRRQVWLLKRGSVELPLARRNVARAGRLRWLQKVDTDEGSWDAFDATRGMPFSTLVSDGKRLPWSDLRHWLHDLASELWEATRDESLPAELTLDHVWITARGNALLLDRPWPEIESRDESIPVGDLAGQQRFLQLVAGCVESTSLPLHARSALQNLAEGKFEKLSFLTGTLRGLLNKPAAVSSGTRAGAAFMLPLYIWILVFVGFHRGGDGVRDAPWDSAAWVGLASLLSILLGSALVQLLEVPLRTTCGHAIFRLAVVNARGSRAEVSKLLARWAVMWLPLLVPMAWVALLIRRDQPTAASISAGVVLMLWIGAAFQAVLQPNRGLHDRLTGTWIVRR